MTEVSFYHLERQGLEEALPRLLTRVLERGYTAVVLTGGTEQSEYLNDRLWTFDPGSFLPHGMKADGYTDQQPIYLTSEEENPAGANVIVVVDGAVPETVENYERCLDLFNGRDETAVQAARDRWRHYRDRGFKITYWRQDENGRWNQQAESG